MGSTITADFPTMATGPGGAWLGGGNCIVANFGSAILARYATGCQSNTGYSLYAGFQSLLATSGSFQSAFVTFAVEYGSVGVVQTVSTFTSTSNDVCRVLRVTR